MGLDYRNLFILVLFYTYMNLRLARAVFGYKNNPKNERKLREAFNRKKRDIHCFRYLKLMEEGKRNLIEVSIPVMDVIREAYHTLRASMISRGVVAHPDEDDITYYVITMLNLIEEEKKKKVCFGRKKRVAKGMEDYYFGRIFSHHFLNCPLCDDAFYELFNHFSKGDLYKGYYPYSDLLEAYGYIEGFKGERPELRFIIENGDINLAKSVARMFLNVKKGAKQYQIRKALQRKKKELEKEFEDVSKAGGPEKYLNLLKNYYRTQIWFAFDCYRILVEW